MTSAASQKLDSMVPLLLLMTATTGLVDAVSVLGLGRVFTANMTGNVVFLGFAFAGAPGYSWPLFVAALLAFAAGAALGGRLHERQSAFGRRRWLIWTGTIEATLLGLAALWDLFGNPQLGSGTAYAIIALTAIAMGLRNATVRQLKVPDLTTTVLTMTITGLFADTSSAGRGVRNAGRRISSVLAILAGAFVGGLLVLASGLALPLAVAGAVSLIATVTLAYDLPNPE